MIKLRVIKEPFIIGTFKHKKGDIISVNPLVADKVVATGFCEKMDKPSPKPKKKRTYKRRDMQAEK